MDEETTSEYFELLRIPTVGADPARLADCTRCAAWLKRWLKPLGFEVEILLAKPREGRLAAPPVVFAERSSSSTRTVLFYGHYDVQPPDPLELWETPPFEPTLKSDGRVYARGAQDDKGQFFSFLCGMRKLIQSGRPIPNIKLLLEGEEENGSLALYSLLPELKSKLAADVLLVCDTESAPNGQPAIVAGLRGVQHFTIELEGPVRDLHSGTHGGIAPNPAQGIAELVASLHDATGACAVEGFMDSVVPPTDEEMKLAAAGAISDEAYAKETGVEPLGGERKLSRLMRGSFQPTIEVNGIHSGYAGAGSKTVIPAKAFAKISLRLVPDQSPAHVLEAMKAHVAAHCPPGMKAKVTEIHMGSAGFRLAVTSPVFFLAQEVLEKIDPRGAVFLWEGASIPIVSELRQLSGGAPLLVGFGLERDHIHSPNESFGREQFEKSEVWAQGILSVLA